MTLLPLANVWWILADALQLVIIVILAEVVVSWLAMMGTVRSYQPWVRNLRRVTDPMLNPFRRLLSPYRTGGLDLSPMIAILLIYLIQGVLYKLGLQTEGLR